jgi:hypothetical protein
VSTVPAGTGCGAASGSLSAIIASSVDALDEGAC